MTNRNKIIIIGLDGLDWRLLNKLIRKDDLPNFREILNSGTSCRIISSIPPLTVPSWIDAFTGVNPGKHGVFHFVKLLPSGDTKVNTLRDLKVDPVWRILHDHGMRVAIIRFPLSMPTNRDGIYIGGFLSPAIDEKCVQPTELISLLKSINYPLSSNFITQISYKIKGKHKEALNYLIKIFRKRAKVMKYIMEKYKPDFIFCLFDTTDRLLHTYIDDKDIVLGFMKEIDSFLGEVLKKLDKNSYLIILSDHGFDEIDKYFFPNDFLADRGYIRISKINVITNKIKFDLLESLESLSTFFKEIIPTSLLEHLVKLVTHSKADASTFKDNEIAKFALAHQIKINPIVAKDREKYNNIREQIINELNSLRDKGSRIVYAFKKEEIYKGVQTIFAPDIVLLTEEKYTISSMISGKIVRNRLIGGKTGDHVSKSAMQNAFFAVYHKDYALEIKSEAGQIIDIAPTILHLLGLKIPKWMEGDILVK